jgi:spore coat protein U-like protein
MAATMDFDQSTQQFAQFQISLPKSWNEGTVTAQFVWVANTGTGNVIWRIAGVAMSDGDAFDVAFGTAVSVTDALIATGDIHISAETGAITIAGTLAAGDEVVLQIDRDAANGSDTLTASARLLGIRLFFTTDTGVDS